MKTLQVVVVLFQLFFGGNLFAEDLKITFINVGQGDSTLIEAPNGKKILIDAGTSWGEESVSEGTAWHNLQVALISAGVTKAFPLDYIFVTHFHYDHYSLIDEVITEFGMPKEGVFDRGGDKRWDKGELSSISEDYLWAVSSHRNSKGAFLTGEKISLGEGAFLEILVTGQADTEKKHSHRIEVMGQKSIELHSGVENTKSLVFLVHWKGLDLLIGGDCCASIERQGLIPLLSKRGIELDILKVFHHGSATSTSRDFLRQAMPEVGICSVGKNSYGHPRKSVYDNLYEVRTKIFQTDKGSLSPLAYEKPPGRYGKLANGNIVLFYNGNWVYSVSTKEETLLFPTDENNLAMLK